MRSVDNHFEAPRWCDRIQLNHSGKLGFARTLDPIVANRHFLMAHCPAHVLSEGAARMRTLARRNRFRRARDHQLTATVAALGAEIRESNRRISRHRDGVR